MNTPWVATALILTFAALHFDARGSFECSGCTASIDQDNSGPPSGAPFFDVNYTPDVNVPISQRDGACDSVPGGSCLGTRCEFSGTVTLVNLTGKPFYYGRPGLWTALGGGATSAELTLTDIPCGDDTTIYFSFDIDEDDPIDGWYRFQCTSCN